jgi:hypothetical protein
MPSEGPSASADAPVGVQGFAQVFASWAANNHSPDARRVLAGLGHLGEFLKAVSTSDIDLELGCGNSFGNYRLYFC